jgi:predicted amidohydrolase
MRYGMVWVTVGLVAASICAPAVPEKMLKVALLQMRPDGNNVPANLAKAEAFCRDAAKGGADIALMPEMWSIGYTRFDAEKPGAREAFYELALSKDGPEIQRFAKLADELDMAIGITYLEEYAPLPRNSITLFDRHGKEMYTYAKVHTSDFKSMEASMTPGEEFYTAALDTRLGPVTVGAMTCFDREQPESARILMLKGAELVLTPNACGLDDLRLQQFRIRAVENVMCVAMANYPSPDQNGHSVAYNARGEERVLGTLREDIFYAEFDLGDLRARRKKTIWGNAYRRPHRYDILTSPDRAPVWDRIDGNGKPYDPPVR